MNAHIQASVQLKQFCCVLFFIFKRYKNTASCVTFPYAIIESNIPFLLNSKETVTYSFIAFL